MCITFETVTCPLKDLLTYLKLAKKKTAPKFVLKLKPSLLMKKTMGNALILKLQKEWSLHPSLRNSK